MEVSVTRKGQVTIPAKFRKKYKIKEGTKMTVEDTPLGLVFKPIPSFQELMGVDVRKYDPTEMKKMLDEMRRKWR
jgi:AbrB family looped-hinge helix DNA binding protein